MFQEKYETLQGLSVPEVNSLITTGMCNSLIHFLLIMKINFKSSQSFKEVWWEIRSDFGFSTYQWTHSNKLMSIADVIPQTKVSTAKRGILYSEHSSYLGMKRFVQWSKPQKIIGTVNVGTLKSQCTMEKYFNEWKLEAGYWCYLIGLRSSK